MKPIAVKHQLFICCALELCNMSTKKIKDQPGWWQPFFNKNIALIQDLASDGRFLQVIILCLNYLSVFVAREHSPVKMAWQEFF